VVGFRGDEAVLMPLGDVAGLGPDSAVIPTGRPFMVGASAALLGRVLDGLGRPADGGGPVAGAEPWPVDRAAPDPLARARVSRPLPLGVRAIDALLTVGEGQRIGVFAGSGVGKSTLMGQIARQTDADVNVIALVGERGREVAEFLDEALGPAGRARSVVVCATSDAPSLVRLKSAFVATAIAEWFRDHGRRVLFMLDSLTRVARAQREVGLAAGEPPARHGYPPSVFALLPRLLERTGAGARGSITALYTVLVAGGDMEEPIADEVRGIVDGHIVLARELAARGHFPAIDVLQSLSRLMDAVTEPAHRSAATRVRALLAAYERQRDLILLGAYQRGSDPRTDEAIARIDAIERFVCQATNEEAPFEDTRRRLFALADST
jgi:type III secretion protein N (ATPase)